MKIVFLNQSHHKNVDAIKRMCSKTEIGLEFTTDFKRCQIPDYDILISNMHFFNPDLIPENIKIIFGPQLFIFPEGHIVGQLNSKWASRCINNTLSKWVEKCYLEVASLVIPTGQFPFAVDTEKFNASSQEKTLDCLIYFKHRSPETLKKVKELLDQKNLKYKVVSYGSYLEEDYINLLHKSKCMISVDAHESQGFALEEAMACNVPLLVFDIQSVYDEYGTQYFQKFKHLKLNATCVPYWSEECGLKTTELNEIPNLIDEMLQKYQTFNPRQFILEKLSEEVCMQKILDWYHK
jgi:hypothetical protein